ncbi:MAG: AmmeMemoRadiSam system protein A [Candidatus Omnitrophica bacterium]|nr:AmmeMemoRadiSam system protein A [Candidatus Omnitrophota bacterium]
MLTGKEKKRLLEIAKSTIEKFIRTGQAPQIAEEAQGLLEEKGAFVTLHYKGKLRGCIGKIIGDGPLYKTVMEMAIESAANDPRFRPVGMAELKDIRIEISVLSKPERVADVKKLKMGIHGVIVKRGFNSGVFLPQVATETGWGCEEFLNNLCAHKACIAADAWKDPRTELYSFTADVFGEE